MTELQHACPVCGDAAHLSRLCDVDDHTVHACAACKADHVWPMPTAAQLKAFYDRRDWFEGGERGGYADFDAQTGWSSHVLEKILPRFGGRKGLSVLDVGCGYGTQLSTLAALGWKCFGVDLSDHARAVAQQRLGGAAHIVESVSELIPHAFDLVLVLDTLEHLPSPYALFYALFSIGAITPKTVVAIATPNAGAADARRDPAAWPYRHPPSHLVFYSAESLRHLLARLHFTDVTVSGTDAGALEASSGLLVTAAGSDFAAFMQERYVPGTWSRIAAYEHIPRYTLAAPFARGKAVLDFGSGTGYGALMLARDAAAVTGLDIDEAAIAWSRTTHRNPRLAFVREANLGASLPADSFDMITCFEMIEHVNHATQKAAIASMARLLRRDGLLFISTPNPEVTKLYGANPYHIREMNAAELRELLAPHFPNIRILHQHVRTGVAFDSGAAGPLKAAPMDADAGRQEPLAFIGVCSRGALPDLPDHIFFDEAVDYIAQFMAQEKALTAARLRAYENGERAYGMEDQRNAVAAHRDAIAVERDTARNEHTAALQQLHALNVRHEALTKTREEELRSPRFLARALVHATRLRLAAEWRKRFGGA